MRTIRARNVVLGAGAMGCATAYQLAKRGEPVLLVEQFEPLHDRGSSRGATRITRHSYADLQYARLMIPAFAAWRELEADAGRTLYVKTGGVSLSPAGVDYVERVASSLAEIGIPHRRMTGEALRRVYPAFEVAADLDVVFEPDAGIVLARWTMGTELELARELGGDQTTIWDRCPIDRIDLDADRPTLIGPDARIEADFLIVTAGAWVSRLFPEWAKGLKVTRQQVTYFAAPNPDAFQIGRFPVFIHKGAEDWDAFYGMPEILGTNVKVARHAGPEFDPASPDRPIDDDYHEVVRRFLRWNIPALASAFVTNTEVCLYTEDPGENFRVGLHPDRPDVLIASPCSGHGFKFSPLVGKVLAEWATAGEPSIDVSAWRWPAPGA